MRKNHSRESFNGQDFLLVQKLIVVLSKKCCGGTSFLSSTHAIDNVNVTVTAKIVSQIRYNLYQSIYGSLVDQTSLVVIVLIILLNQIISWLP